MPGLVITSRQRERLQRQLEETKEARVFRRTLAVLEFGRGTPITHIAQALGIDRRSVHRWIGAYAETHDPTVLRDENRPGRPCVWANDLTRRLERLMVTSPEDLGYFAVNWTVPLLQTYLEQSTGRWFSDDTIRRRLRQSGYVWKRSRYVLAPDPDREKKKTHSTANRPFAVPECRAGRG